MGRERFQIAGQYSTAPWTPGRPGPLVLSLSKYERGVRAPLSVIPAPEPESIPSCPLSPRRERLA